MVEKWGTVHIEHVCVLLYNLRSTWFRELGVDTMTDFKLGGKVLVISKFDDWMIFTSGLGCNIVSTLSGQRITNFNNLQDQN